MHWPPFRCTTSALKLLESRALPLRDSRPAAERSMLAVRAIPAEPRSTAGDDPLSAIRQSAVVDSAPTSTGAAIHEDDAVPRRHGPPAQYRSDPRRAMLLVGLSPPAHAELLQLLDHCAVVCRKGLEGFEPFVPFGLGRRADGRHTLIGGPLLMPSAVTDPVSYVYEAMATPGRFTAVAVAEHVGDEASPFLRIYCEHSEGRAFRTSIPWQRLADENIRLLSPIVDVTQPVVLHNTP